MEIKPESVIARLGLRVTSQFIPFSQSRNKGKKYRSLNWRVTLWRGDREILTCDYSAGEAHCPSYRPGLRTVDLDDALKQETETGRTYTTRFGIKGKPIEPNETSVIYSLAIDSNVLDYATYESWASEFGYDPDSRKGEATYRVCLELALKLRAAIGDAELTALREAFQDY